MLAVEIVIEKIILSRFRKKAQDRDSESAKLIDKFWEEHEAFVQWKGFFNWEQLGTHMAFCRKRGHFGP
jgi:hypothetical protein